MNGLLEFLRGHRKMGDKKFEKGVVKEMPSDLVNVARV